MIYLWRVNLKKKLAQAWIYKNVSLLQNMMMVIGEWKISNGVGGVVVDDDDDDDDDNDDDDDDGYDNDIHICTMRRPLSRHN